MTAHKAAVQTSSPREFCAGSWLSRACFHLCQTSALLKSHESVQGAAVSNLKQLKLAGNEGYCIGPHDIMQNICSRCDLG